MHQPCARSISRPSEPEPIKGQSSCSIARTSLMAASLSAAVAGVVMCLDTRGKEATCLPARLGAKPDRFVAAVVA